MDMLFESCSFAGLEGLMGPDPIWLEDMPSYHTVDNFMARPGKLHLRLALLSYCGVHLLTFVFLSLVVIIALHAHDLT